MASCENRPNFAWQACLFAFSALTRARATATLVVHTQTRELHPWFRLAQEKAGARIVMAPSFRGVHNYGPRNTAGTLVAVADAFPGGDVAAVCDADLVFAGQLPRGFATGGVVADWYPVVKTDNPLLHEVVSAFGLDPARWEALGHARRAGVPYFIPVAECRRLGEAWAEAIDAFGRRPFWEAQMTAFAMACARLELPIHLRRSVHVTYRNELLRLPVIHYGWRCEGWFKHDYYGHKAVDFWTSCENREAPPGTLMDEVFRQVRECRAFYGM